MAKMNNSSSFVVMIVVLALAASAANCQLFNPITQAIVTGPAGGLTCSNPSPLFFQPPMPNANVTMSCLGGSNFTIADSSGRFTLAVNFPIPINAASVVLNCRVRVLVPSSCVITFFWQRVTTLRSTPLAFQYYDPIGSATFRAEPFSNFF